MKRQSKGSRKTLWKIAFCGILRRRKLSEWMGISRKHLLQPKFLPLYHVYWQHELPPPADFPLCLLRYAVWALLLFPSVYSPLFCGRGGLYALRVIDCVAGGCVSPCVCPHPFHQRRPDLFPKPASDCGVIEIGRGCVRWKNVGQISPFAAVVLRYNSKRKTERHRG